MKKIITILGITLLGFIVVNAILSLTSSEIKNYTDKGYILSDNFTTFDECNTTKNNYNVEYSSYKRSDCFSNGEGYKYFICQLSDRCSISTTSNNTVYNNSISQTTTIPNKEILDKALLVLKSKPDYLDQFQKTLNNAKEENKDNTNIMLMVNYLQDGINQITGNKEEDDFLCMLTGGCNTNTTSVNNTTTNISIQEQATSTTWSTQQQTTITSTYPGCTSPDITLSNGQIWASCDVGNFTFDVAKTKCANGYNLPSEAEWINAFNINNLSTILGVTNNFYWINKILDPDTNVAGNVHFKLNISTLTDGADGLAFKTDSLGVRCIKSTTGGITIQTPINPANPVTPPVTPATTGGLIWVIEGAFSPMPVACSPNFTIPTAGAVCTTPSACSKNSTVYSCTIPSSSAINFHGQVLDSETNQPLSGVSVSIYSGGPVSFIKDTTTDSNGNWSITGDKSTHNFAWFHDKNGYKDARISLVKTGIEQQTVSLEKYGDLVITPSTVEFYNVSNSNEGVINLINVDLSDIEMKCSGSANVCNGATSRINPSGYAFYTNSIWKWQYNRTYGNMSLVIIEKNPSLWGGTGSNINWYFRKKSDRTKEVTATLTVTSSNYVWNKNIQSNSPRTGFDLSHSSCGTTPTVGASCTISKICAVDGLPAGGYTIFQCGNPTIQAIAPKAFIEWVQNGVKNPTNANPNIPFTLSWRAEDTTQDKISSSIIISGSDCKVSGLNNSFQPWNNNGTSIQGVKTYLSSLDYAGCKLEVKYVARAINSSVQGAFSTATINFSEAINPVIGVQESITSFSIPSGYLNYTISGLDYDNAMGCQSVHAHPNVPSAVNSTRCNNSSNFVYLKNVSGWSYSNGIWKSTVNADPSIFVSGVMFQSSFMDSRNTQVIKHGNIITVTGGTTSTTTTTSSITMCSNWQTAEQYTGCVGGKKIYTITSCYPPGYDNPNYWNWNHTNNNFSHTYGESCN